mmetsp:Transcript_77751/g.251870  ORF Transcript_77751/g.251870 Transcript_77751/m.251870 type:complete len:211 (-) Transcript_77751:1427-2059(-)
MRPSFLRLASMSCRWNLRSKPINCFSCSAFISSCFFSMPIPRTSAIMVAMESRKICKSAWPPALPRPLPSAAPRRVSAPEASRSWRIFICSRSVRSESTNCAFSRLARKVDSSSILLASSTCRSMSILSANHCLFATSKPSLCFERSLSRESRTFVDLASVSANLRCIEVCRSSWVPRSSSQSFCTLSVMRGKIQEASTSVCAGPAVCSK